MDQLVDSLMERLNYITVFTIPLFGRIDVESVVCQIIMAIILRSVPQSGCMKKIRKINGKHSALESGFLSFITSFWILPQEKKERDYIPYQSPLLSAIMSI